MGHSTSKDHPGVSPAALAPDFASIPIDLQAEARWVVWKREFRDGKPTKIPYTPGTHRKASSTAKKTWRTFAEALNAYVGGGFDGVGFMLGDGWTGVDLDHCRDPRTGEPTALAAETVIALDTYTEWSPSREGLHIYARGCLPEGGRHRGDVECTSAGAFSR